MVEGRDVLEREASQRGRFIDPAIESRQYLARAALDESMDAKSDKGLDGGHPSYGARELAIQQIGNRHRIRVLGGVDRT